MRSRRLGLAVGLLLLLLALGHYGYWYGARARPGVPATSGPLYRVLEDERLSASLWLAYPHQNLARLEKEVPDYRKAVVAAVRLGGHAEPRLPRFGRLAVPPARELVVGIGSEGGTVVVANVYPLMARLARLSGGLTGNSWLSGGAVGESASVRWCPPHWIYATDSQLSESLCEAGETPDRAEQSVWSATPALLRLRLSQAEAGFEGRFRLEIRTDGEGRHLQLLTDAGRATEISGNPLAADELVLLYDERPGPEGGSSRGRALLINRGPAASEGEIRLPSAVAFGPTGSQLWRLPAHRLLQLADVKPVTDRREGFDFVASDEDALARGLLAHERLTTMAPQLRHGLWLRPQPLFELAHDLEHGLGALPMGSQREHQRWQDIETIAAALEGVEALSWLDFGLAGD